MSSQKENENTIIINQTCVKVVLYLTIENDLPRILIHFDTGDRIRLIIDQDVSYDYDEIYDFLGCKITSMEIGKDYILFKIPGYYKDSNEDVKCNITVLGYVWRHSNKRS
jgi:hypothetical protein